MGITIENLVPAFGAKIGGVNLAGEVDGETFSEIEAAFERYSVLVFHGQQLTDEQQIVFSRRFGELESTVSTRLTPP